MESDCDAGYGDDVAPFVVVTIDSNVRRALKVVDCSPVFWAVWRDGAEGMRECFSKVEG